MTTGIPTSEGVYPWNGSSPWFIRVPPPTEDELADLRKRAREQLGAERVLIQAHARNIDFIVKAIIAELADEI